MSDSDSNSDLERDSDQVIDYESDSDSEQDDPRFSHDSFYRPTLSDSGSQSSDSGSDSSDSISDSHRESSDSDSPSSDSDSEEDDATIRAQRAQQHEDWLKRRCIHLEKQLQRLSEQLEQSGQFRIDDELIMLLTLVPSLLESLPQQLQALPEGVIQELNVDLTKSGFYRRRNTPSKEALLATASELANIVSNIDSIRRLDLSSSTSSMTSLFLTACPRLDYVDLDSCPLVTEHLQSLFAIKTLRSLKLHQVTLPKKSIKAFCLGMENSSLESLTMYEVVMRPKHEKQVARALARSKTLITFYYQQESQEGPSFVDYFCKTLSNNFDSKLERLELYLETMPGTLDFGLDLDGDDGTVGDIDPAIAAKICNLLKWNVQRKTCPPLFAAIGNAETDDKRKECLVEAFAAVDFPVVFEYITSNQNNLIELIQRLGRSRKRQRED